MPYKNKADRKAAGRRWYLAHRELVCQRSKQWKRDNPEKRYASHKAWQERNREKLNAWQREYRKRKKANHEHDERMRRPFPITEYMEADFKSR